MMGVILLYLAAASIWQAAGPSDSPGLYGHWLLWALGVAMLVNLAMVTLYRIPLRTERLGAWISHAGLVVLVFSGAWYAAFHISQRCMTFRSPEGDWSPITHSFAKTFPLVFEAVWADGGDCVIGLDPAGEPRGLPVDKRKGTVSVTVLGLRIISAEQMSLRAVVHDGQWRKCVDLPIVPGDPSNDYVLAKDQATHLPVKLSDGRTVHLGFTGPVRLPEVTKLPQTIRVRRVQYKTWPASEVPRDLICDLEIGEGAAGRKETLALNSPVTIGEFRLSQGRWLPTPATPMQMSFGISTRPGLWGIWVGCAMICLGVPYGFYVKPLIMRFRRSR